MTNVVATTNIAVQQIIFEVIKSNRRSQINSARRRQVVIDTLRHFYFRPFQHFTKIFNDIWTKLEGRDFVLNIFFNFRTDVSYNFFICFRYRVENGPGPSRMDNLDFFLDFFWTSCGFFSRIFYMFQVKIMQYSDCE